MAQFKTYIFEELFDMLGGYVLSFNNRTFSDFIEQSVDINIYDEKYTEEGGSKAKCLRSFWKKEPNSMVAKLLEDLLEYYNDTVDDKIKDAQIEIYKKCEAEITKLKDSSDSPTDKLESISVKEDRTIRALKKSIVTDLSSFRYNSAIDRLHTFSVFYFRQKAVDFGIDISKDKPLHSIAGEMIKKASPEMSETTHTILKSSLSVLDKFNGTRNNESLSHPNIILENREARLIIDWVLNLLSFIDDTVKPKRQLSDNDVPF